MSLRPTSLLTALLASTGLMLSACGGGGGGSSAAPTTTTPTTPVSTITTYEAGVYKAESTYKDRCQSPRSGTNPATGSAFPDISGSTAIENFWLRSWSQDKYLWYSELPDLNPNSYTDRLEYFGLLKTTATTASGTPKDQFHFSRNTEEYQEQVSSGSSSGYGVRFVILDSTAPDRSIRVSYTEPNSPATTAGLLRGTEILEVDGASVANGTAATLNAGLFPSNDGEAHNFKVRDIGSTTIRDITMTSQSVTSAPVNVKKTIDVGSNKVGYMLFNTFGTSIAEEAVVNAMTEFQTAGVSDLIIDLRYNGGGFLDISAELGYMVAGSAQTNGKIFDRLTFNDKYPNTNPVTGAALSGTPFHSRGRGFSVPTSQALPSLNLPRVFILSTARTCSASEALINGLRGADVDVILIGGKTCGKPYGFYGTDNCGETYFTIQFSGSNNKGFGDYADGFVPNDNAGAVGTAITGCTVPDDYLNQLGDEGEAMLSTAITYIETNACPPAAVTAAKTAELSAQKETNPYGSEATAIGQTDRLKFQEFLETSRILTPPQKGAPSE